MRIKRIYRKASVFYVITRNTKAAAVFYDHVAIPVNVDSEFGYPDEAFYTKLKAKQVLNVVGENADSQIEKFEDLVRHTFEEISLTIDANGSARAIDLAINVLTKRYRACIQTPIAGHVRERLVLGW